MKKEKAKKSIFKRWWFWALAIMIIVGIAGIGDETADPTNDDPVNDTSAEEPDEVTEEEDTGEELEEPEEEEAGEPELETFSSGMYEVGNDIDAGIYYNPEGSIYVERLAGFSGEFDDIIANANPDGPYYVEIKESDAAVNFGNDGWRKFDEDEKERHEIKTELSSGIYIVGIDIEPGKYKLEGNGIYWARLSGVSLEMDSVIANGNPDGGSAIVEVAPDDFAFEVSGGTWSKME